MRKRAPNISKATNSEDDARILHFGRWIASAPYSDYRSFVKFVRALTLICFSFGLLVQVAAQAAVPQSEMAGSADCAEMAQSMAEHCMSEHAMPEQMVSETDPAEQHGSCCEMSLDCLVAMNCLPPLALAGPGLAHAGPFPVAPTYLAASANRLDSQPRPPESPPPQTELTI